jgi:hypothetical protein
MVGDGFGLTLRLMVPGTSKAPLMLDLRNCKHWPPPLQGGAGIVAPVFPLSVLNSAHPETRNFGRDQGMQKILPQAYS